MSKFSPSELRRTSIFRCALLSATVFLILFHVDLMGQNVPEAINYQAIVRDASTYLPISDQAAYVSVEFLDGPNGDVLYQEEFSAIQTGKTGLINLSLGQGDPMINSFDAISWQSGNVWLRLSVDVGSGLNILQETPFNTVPYAFFAASSGSSSADGDGDSTNELIQEISIDGSNLVISEGDQTQSVDLNLIREDDDSDPTNEIQTLNIDGSALGISGTESTIDLSTVPGFGVDDDSDPSNELQELELSGNSLSLSNSPDNSQVDLTPYLDNTDSQTLSLEGTSLSISGDPSTIDLSELPGLGDDADADSTNEIQYIESTDGSITVTPNGNDFDLSVAAVNASEAVINDGQNTTINGTGTSSDPYSIDVPDNLDNDPNNEIQDISTDNSAGNIALSDGSTLTLNVNDADADATNEIQNIESADGSITVTPSGNDFDLSVAAADGSETVINDAQNTTISGTGTSADPYEIDVPDNLDNDPVNEIQDISTDNSAGNIALSDGSTLTLNVNDADADATNEFQDLGNTVVTPNEEVEITLTNGSNTTINIQDADADSENELQNIQLSGDFLSLTNVSPAAQVDMSPYDQSDLSQGHIFIGDGSDKASEVEVFGDLILDDSGETKVSAIMGTDVSGVPPTDGQILVYSGADSEWQPQSAVSVSPSSETSYYSLDPLDFRELTDNAIGVDLESHNALKFFDDDAPFAMLRDEGIIEIMAPIHLPHGATINNLKIYFRDVGPGNMRFSLFRKDMTNFSVGNDILTAILASGTPGDSELSVNITNLNEVDNSIYSYRLYARFSSFESFDTVDLDNVDQRIYGAVIEYTTN